jgi:hypothetical protein
VADSTERLLGQLIESVAGLRRDITDLRGDFDQEKDHAHESRRDVHQKIDALTGRVAAVEGTVQIAMQVTAQTRDKVAAIEPTVEEFKRIKLMGHGVIWAVGIAGGALGLTASSWVAPAVKWIKTALGIQ